MVSQSIEIYELNDDHSLILHPDLNKIEISKNKCLIGYILLNDDQCSKITNCICETNKELFDLLMDLLNTVKSNISIKDEKYLEISFPIYFGADKSRMKLWNLKIEIQEITITNDLSLDPQDWTDVRLLGHQIMDDMINYLRDIRLRPAWQPMPLAVKQNIMQTNIPLEGQSPYEVYKEVCSLVLPYPVGNFHPHFWGYVQGSGSPMGILAELITATMNTMSWGGHQASIYIERQVLSWLKVLMGFPNDDTSSGILVSGTSAATIIAIAVAKRKFENRKMNIYCSKETHSCLYRAMDLLNIGKESLIFVPTNTARQIDIKALEAMLNEDSCGIIVGSAGTVGTGSIDDLQSLADICARRPNDFWFHVDGAIGAVARCSNRLRPLLSGLERADSIAFDLHKWLSIQYECGCILVRDGRLHKAVFGHPPASYLTLMDGGITPSEGELFFIDYGFEMSREMKSLKVWMALKTYGIEKIGQIMDQNVNQARHFAKLIEQNSNKFELSATGPLNIVCFRYIVSREKPIDLDTLNKLNKKMLVSIQERGIGVVSPIIINNDIFAMRMCIVSHRTRMSDMDRFMTKLIELADLMLDLPEFSCLTDLQ